MSKFGRELVASMREAVDYAESKPVRGARVTVVDVPDVRQIRRKLDMSQAEFARAYRIPLATIKNWEQGRRLPDAPAAAYLLVIERRPKLVRETVAA